MGVRRGSHTMTGSTARPRAKATGTRRMTSRPKVPKRMRATSPGDMVISAQPRDGPRVSPQHRDGDPGPLGQEQDPRRPGHDVDAVDDDHVDAGQLGGLDPAEPGVLIAVGHEDAREDEHEAADP